MNGVIGIQAARAVLTDAPGRARNLILLQGRRDARINELIHLAKSTGVRFQSLQAAVFKRKLQDMDVDAETAHQGVLLECQALALADESELLRVVEQTSNPLILILDGITDPRNLGACLRSANAVKVDAVVVPKRNSAPLSALALKTAQGGAENLLIAEVTNLARTLEALKAAGVWLIGAAGEAEQSYTQVDMKGAVGIILGSEGKGLRRLTKECCDHLVSLPMLGTVESLNVAVACGVMLYETVRQRQA